MKNALEALVASLMNESKVKISSKIMYPVVNALVDRHSRGGKLVGDTARFHHTLDQIAVENMTDRTLVSVARSIQITNAFIPNITNICIRLQPREMFPTANEIPYSTFFMYAADNYIGYHVRFRAIARGGLRVVTNPNATPWSAMNECYSLAYAQHLKNKDIPESGSKGVLLVRDPKNIDRSVLGAVDSLLDCTLPHEDVMHANLADNIYLGPDEQITNHHINEIIKLATIRGHSAPRTFITSKPAIGFNHKALGITSEGVEAFMFAAMRKLHFPRNKMFTVKITGGPDGDVAGNMLKILYKEYGDWCKIVGIADGTAVCENDDGISWHYLMNLVRGNKPLSHLEDKSSVLKLTNTPENIKARDTMQERVKADVFIPAGGRPFTVNESNYKKVAETTKLIVEGANLFISSGARDRISKEFGVPIIKDSSANKGGVCCSSLEVLSSMLLLEHEITLNKEKLDEEVIQYIRKLAKTEAEKLLSYYPLRRDLHRVSEEMSNAIIKRKDEVYDQFCRMEPDQTFKALDRLMKPVLPPTLVSLGWKRIRTHIPLDYARMMVSAFIASNEIYKVSNL